MGDDRPAAEVHGADVFLESGKPAPGNHRALETQGLHAPDHVLVEVQHLVAVVQRGFEPLCGQPFIENRVHAPRLDRFDAFGRGRMGALVDLAAPALDLAERKPVERHDGGDGVVGGIVDARGPGGNPERYPVPDDVPDRADSELHRHDKGDSVPGGEAGQRAQGQRLLVVSRAAVAHGGDDRGVDVGDVDPALADLDGGLHAAHELAVDAEPKRWEDVVFFLAGVDRDVQPHAQVEHAVRVDSRRHLQHRLDSLHP